MQPGRGMDSNHGMCMVVPGAISERWPDMTVLVASRLVDLGREIGASQNPNPRVNGFN
jgi:hypothetical protein